MLSLPPAIKIFFCTKPADMRKSFDGLAGMVQGVLEDDPFSGHLFVFVNKRRDRVKLLWWDDDGFCLWYKRLEKGTFRFPAGDAPSLSLPASELTLLLQGVDLSQAKRQRRYRRPA